MEISDLGKEARVHLFAGMAMSALVSQSTAYLGRPNYDGLTIGDCEAEERLAKDSYDIAFAMLREYDKRWSEAVKNGTSGDFP